MIDSILRPHQAVICADTGHIAVHESGAIEATGHKVITVPSEDGKITAAQVRQVIDGHWSDATHEHCPQPALVYLSHPTETGLIYTKRELTELRRVCDEKRVPLYLDGARLGYALASGKSDVFMDTLRTDIIPARLEGLFNRYARADKCRPGIPDDGGKPRKGRAVCEKIVDEQYPVPGAQKVLRNDNIVSPTVGKALHLSRIDISRDIFGLAFFRKNNGAVKNLSCDAGYPYPGRFDCKDFCHVVIFKKAMIISRYLSKSTRRDKGSFSKGIPPAVRDRGAERRYLSRFIDSAYCTTKMLYVNIAYF